MPNIDIFVKTKANTKGLDKATRKMRRFSDSTKQASKKFAIGVAAMGTAAIAFGASAVKAFNEQTIAETKLRTNFMNLKGATEAQFDSLTGLAGHLQKVGVVGDEVTISGMSQLATFKLQKSSIEKLTPKILDMATQLKGTNVTTEDMITLNNLVGRVMTGNAGALTRYGITLSESQKQMIKQGDETQRATVLTEVLSQNFGDVNKKLAETPTGKMKQLANDAGDFKEKVGKLITDSLQPIVGFLKDKLLPKLNEFADWFEKNPEDIAIAIGIITGVIVAGLIPAMVTLAGSIWAAIAPLLPFIALGAVIGGMIAVLIKWLQSGSESAKNFKKPFLKIWEIFSNNLLPILKLVWGFIKNQFIVAWNELKAAIEPHIKEFKNLAIVLGVVLLTPILLVVGAIGLIIAIMVAAVLGIMKLIAWIIKLKDWWLNLKVTMLKAVIGAVSSVVRWFRSLPGKIGGALSRIPGMISGFFKSAKDKAIAQFQGIINFVRGIPSKISGGMLSAARSVVNPMISAFNKLPVPDIPLLAKGTKNFAGGMAVVGEQGPELVALPRGSQVIPNNQIGQVPGGRSLSKDQSAGGDTQITVYQSNLISQSVDMVAGMRELGYLLSLT